MASPRPPLETRKSLVPGGFDTDEELSPIKTTLQEEDIAQSTENKAKTSSNTGQATSGTPNQDDSSFIGGDNDTFLQEKEMRQKLEDFDSTFLQDVSPVAPVRGPTAGDLSTISEESAPSEATTTIVKHSKPDQSADPEEFRAPSPPSPSMYHTPAPGPAQQPSSEPQHLQDDQSHPNTSSLETLSSSPTAAAAARTISRAVSSASTNAETLDESRGGIPLDQHGTPRKYYDESTAPQFDSPTPTKAESTSRRARGSVEEVESPSHRRMRPPFLNSRMNSTRSSYSSQVTEASDATLEADYALQSGGAMPEYSRISSRPTEYSRSISLGSMASGISAISGEDDRIKAKEGRLSALEENADESDPRTPVTLGRKTSNPTDTVINRHVDDVRVPETLAREYRNRQRSQSPVKRAGPTPAGRNSNNMTLKEQSTTIDRLMKENWNLKLKITFLDEALNRKSDDSVKAMISENVDLRTAKFQSAKDTRELKRSIRDLERKLKEKSDELSEKTKSSVPDIPELRPDEEAFTELEEEVTYLRERVTNHDVEIEKARYESFVQETEKKKLAEVVRQLSSTKQSSDIGVREEVDLWKDLLDAETARREQADETNRRLQEEIRRLKADGSSSTTNNFVANAFNAKRKQKQSSVLSYTNSSDRGFEQNGPSTAVSSTLVDQLRLENAELRREVGAQTSMLTSRNRERERLQQEIEDLKLGARRGDGTRSIAGESIFERSASRAHGRPGSRASDQTRMTPVSDSEREALELTNGHLRDQNAKLRLEIQSLAGQADQLLDELEHFDVLKVDHEKLQQLYDNDISLATEDLQNLQTERDDVLRAHDDMEAELHDVKAEGSEKIAALEEELEQRGKDIEHLQNELSDRAEDAEALRQEVRTLSESMLRIEEDVDSKKKRIRELELEVDELGHEADAMDKDLREGRDKNTKLSVQHESAQSEVAFLREEQEGDKIKIGDLEDALNNLQASLASERDKANDLEVSIADERHQREIIDSKEKQEVQKVMNDLNRELSSSKDESRKVRKNLDTRTNEATSLKERLNELETHLKAILGEPNGTRTSLMASVTKMQKELQTTLSELETVQRDLSEKDRLVRNRDALLESHGLETKKLADLLERERQGRRADKTQHDQWQRTHQQTTRTVSQKDVHITELERSRATDRKRAASLESHYKDVVLDRHTLLINLWNRISTVCGSDWQHQHSLINNHLPTVESISNKDMYGPFSKNLLGAISAIENNIIGFQSRIKVTERNLWSEYESLEHTLDARIKKLDKLEMTVQSHRVSGAFTAAPEIAKLRGENRLLKSDLAALQKEAKIRGSPKNATHTFHPTASVDVLQEGGKDIAAPPPTLARHHSSSAVEHLAHATGGPHSPLSPSRRSSSRQQVALNQEPITTGSKAPEGQAVPEPNQARWIHRLRELERRLKAEREARLLDRSGARKRLEEGAEENRRLKGELDREKVRRGGEPGGG
ncbi:uncharacterized protein KY384_005739 [Bacidia gigantensis]|uniref:uncharacterized protein n=1 Tax=Bacidia gigantensis TaxID=2732470 RepID=UPI001D046BA5|nr:uncharacterized protein KY384_005739 [Bacidia gigantensis]KAG8529104.1 hypothetical protein KY384_005739 [Bacidia gigantensis]